jgi:hypothetical protein
MGVTTCYRGRAITADDVAGIRRIIAENPAASRRELSRRVCVAWNWVQPNGALRDMLCRGLMLALHRAGLIELPPQRCLPVNNAVLHRKRQLPAIDVTPIEAKLSELGPLTWRQVRRTPDEALFEALIAEHHYLGYTRPVGEHLKFMVWAQDRPLACLAWSSAPLQLGPRDRFVGWSPAARRRNLHLIAYNPRYLILPWVRVPHLASHVLGRMMRILSTEWERVYGHPIHFAETFVDISRYRGTCYRAANWVSMGWTSGRGKDAPTRERTRPIKEVLGFPLTKHFRALLARLP